MSDSSDNADWRDDWDSVDYSLLAGFPLPLDGWDFCVQAVYIRLSSLVDSVQNRGWEVYARFDLYTSVDYIVYNEETSLEQRSWALIVLRYIYNTLSVLVATFNEFELVSEVFGGLYLIRVDND